MTPHKEISGRKSLQPLSSDQDFFPFPVQLHLKPFIDQWLLYPPEDNKHILGGYASVIQQLLSDHPFLLEPIEDLEKLKAHQDVLKILFSPVLPPEGWNNTIQAACLPFHHSKIIAATNAYKDLIYAEDGQFEIQNLSVSKERVDIQVLYGYKIILKKFYNLDIKIENPVNSSFINHTTGLSRYYKLSGNMRFIDVHNLAPLPKLDKGTLQKLMEHQFDPKKWANLLPPEIFLFSGISLISLVDITIEESATRLQSALLSLEDSNETQLIDHLTQEMRNLFRIPKLRLGLATVQLDGKLDLNTENNLWNSLLLSDISIFSEEKESNFIYNEILRSGKSLIVEDLEELAQNPVNQALFSLGYSNVFLNSNGTLRQGTMAMLEMGYRNILITPLYQGEKILGIMELASPDPAEINGLSLIKINQLKPIYVNAIRRYLQDFENKVEAVMLEEYTAIHPTIHWRFRQAAIQHIERQTSNGVADEIIFENVFPFYGSLDIRDSSMKRNQAIIRDLYDNLGAAHQVLTNYSEALSFDILGELLYSIKKRMDKLHRSFSAGDETSLANFIRKQINPVIGHLIKQHPELSENAEQYKKILDSESGLIERNRQSYDEALLLINETMAEYIDEEEEKLQRLFPCYFKKYQTDGVEYNIYMGASLAPQHTFNPLYLNNLRLQQLQWTCRIMHEIDNLQPLFATLLQDAHLGTEEPDESGKSRSASMQIAPLILAYGTPVTLKFRMDEKHLDVDGSYNVRYEIIKKRIDKALIKGTEERLTQPGHIAIVYTRKEEAAAYRSHLGYLASQNYLEPEWEELELEALQGVDGLKALRVKTCK